MEGRSSGRVGHPRGSLLLALAAVVGAVTYCDGAPRQEAQKAASIGVTQLSDTVPIPAPPQAFGDSADPAVYLAYGRSLAFATESATTSITRHVTGSAVSRLRISPERRLVTTPDSAFVTGRIIAQFQTDSGVSPYNTPIGLAYLWVRRVGTVYRAQLITDEPTLPALGRILAVPSFYHVPLTPDRRLTTFCFALDSSVAGVCCRCFSGCWNPWPVPIGFDRVDSLVRALIN
jgi:hypothetical protein